MNSKLSRITKSTIITSALVAGSAYCENVQTSREYARMQPFTENKMEILAPITKDFFSEGISIEDIKRSTKGFELPMPSTATATIEDQYEKYVLKEMRLKETIRYQNFTITLAYVSYTFKEISATFIITAGEEEWKLKAFPKKEQKIDYVDFDNERAFRLNLLIDQVTSPNSVTLRLFQQKINPEEAIKMK